MFLIFQWLPEAHHAISKLGISISTIAKRSMTGVDVHNVVISKDNEEIEYANVPSTLVSSIN